MYIEDGITVAILSNFDRNLGAEELEFFIQEIITGQTNFTRRFLLTKKIVRDLYIMGDQDDIKAQTNVLEKLIANYTDKFFLNSLGYSLIGEGYFNLAKEIFKKNVEVNPGYANGYDSLGEFYMNTGNKDLAIKNYQKSLELDTGNDNARQMLKKLKTDDEK